MSSGLFDWPDIDISDWQLPAIPLPDFSLPDLPGATAQWVVAVPLAAAALGLFAAARSNRLAAWVAISAALATLGFTGWQLYEQGGQGTTELVTTIGPLSFGELTVPLQLEVTRLGALIALVVALVGAVVQIFARWYLWFDPRYKAFSATVSLFTAAMLLTVLSSDIMLTLIGWEVMGWCSFLLIGHLSAKDAANRAAGKALLVTRLADVGMVLGLIALAAPARTTSIPRIIEHWTGPAGAADGGLLTFAMLGVVIAVAGKSALVPFQDWLPDAMEGPAPTSALIHAATMVAAGTVVLSQLFPLLNLAAPARLTLAVLASITVVLGALMAFAQPDLKRLLAWSTVSQVALMLGALSVVPAGGVPDAALFHLIAHALFKALLFLVLGWLGVLAGGTLIRYATGTVRRYRSLRRPMGLGLLALVGVPPLVGFVSKELVLSQAEAGVAADVGISAGIVLAAMGASVPLTAAYAMRAWLVLTKKPMPHGQRGARTGPRRIDDFFEEPDVVAEALGTEQAEAAISYPARLGISVLALLTLLGGLLPFTPLIQVPATINLQLLAASMLLMAASALAVWGAARGVRTGDAAARLPAGLTLAVERGLGAGRLYHRAVAVPVLALAKGVMWLDREVIDAYVRGFAHAARHLGTVGRRTESARPVSGLVLVVAGLVALGWLAVTLT